MKKFNLRFNKLTEEGKAATLSSCLHQLDVLDVTGCQLTTRGIKQLTTVIRQRSTPVRNAGIFRGILNKLSEIRLKFAV